MRKEKAIKNISFSLLLQIIAIICGFIVPKLIIENYGSNVNGLITSITQFLAYISLLQAGMGPVVKSVLYKPIAKKDKKGIEDILRSSEKFFKKIALIFIVYILILCFIYPIFINTEFDSMFSISLLLIISISTFAEYYFGITYELYLQAEQRTYIVSILQIITTILNTILIIVLVKLNCNIQIVKLVSVIVFIIRPILQNIYVKNKYQINLKEANKNYKLEKKWDGLAQHIAAVMHGNTDVIILTIFTTLSEVSVYAVYNLVIMGIKRFISSFTSGVDALFGNMLANDEHEHLNKSFKIYETLYFTIITIIFICALNLITPFISIYTSGITDTNYSRLAFGYLIVIAEFFHSIRLPYSTLTLAAGHFKETRIGAWVEAIINILLSVILVFKFGIIGVAIGTLVAMVIRTIEFIYHSSKYILKRNIFDSFKRLIVITFEVLIVLLIMNVIPQLEYNGYINWIINAFVVAIITIIIVLPINYISYKDSFKTIFKRGGKNENK